MKTADEWVSEGAPAPEPTPPTPEPSPESPPGGGSLATPEPGTLATPEAAAPTAAELEMLEVWLDEEGKEKLNVPLTARIPWSQKGEDGRSTLKEIREAHLFHRDYTPKMQAVAKQRQELERNARALELDKAAIAAERQVFQEEIDRFKAAQGDPEAMDRLAADQERLRTDPQYRKLYEDAMEKRRIDARSSRDTELQRFEESQSIADDAADYITRTAAQYPGVDPDEIRQRFAEGLQAGKMELNARTVDQLFQSEKAKLDRAAAPHLKELEGMRKRLEALEAGKHNGEVIAALKAPGAPITGAPPPRSPAPPSTALDAPAPGETLETRGKAWAKRR